MLSDPLNLKHPNDACEIDILPAPRVSVTGDSTVYSFGRLPGSTLDVSLENCKFSVRRTGSNENKGQNTTRIAIRLESRRPWAPANSNLTETSVAQATLTLSVPEKSYSLLEMDLLVRSLLGILADNPTTGGFSDGTKPDSMVWTTGDSNCYRIMCGEA